MVLNASSTSNSRRLRITLLCVLPALLIVGCTHHPTYLENPDQNATLIADLTEKPFRGRWWSLYERAVTFQKYELWDIAEKDIRDAMSIRTQDQRWARTYGMHFMPEYFPNRELGIVLYYQGQYDEAVGYLEASMAQTESARAAFYLDEARREKIAREEPDTTPPTLEILYPDLSTPISSTQINLDFIAHDDNYVNKISINGESAPLRVSQQEVIARNIDTLQPVDLSPGKNSILIEAEDLSGNRTSKTVTLDLDADGPAVQFESPLVLPGPIRGVVADPAGVEDFYIGDQRVALSRNNDGTYQFATNVSGTVNVFRCLDGLGNETRGLVDAQEIAIVIPDVLRNTQLAAERRVETLSDDVVAVYQGSELVGMIRTASANTGTVDVQFSNLNNDQAYYREEVVAVLEIASPAPIESVTLNGNQVDGIVPTWTSQRVSRRIRLSETGEHQIVARVQDVNGVTSETAVTIERVAPEVDDLSNRLQVALLGSLAEDDESSLRQYADFVRDKLQLQLEAEKRFGVLERDSIENVVEEQQLVAALGTLDARRSLGQLKLADYLLIGDLRRHADYVEILVHAIDSLTFREVIVDVFGLGRNREELTTLSNDLSLRLEQAFPRVQGSIEQVTGGGRKVLSTLRVDQRVREDMYCVVYRPVEVFDQSDPTISLGTNFEIIAEGTLEKINKDGSRIQLLFDGSDSEIRPEPTDLVSTK